MMRLLALFSIVIFLSCQDAVEAPPEQGKSIYYYPTSNVYFDQDNNQYIVLSGPDGWVTKEELSPEQESNLGPKVVVANAAVPVWKANDDHKMIYGASLYTTSDDFRQKFTEDSINSLPKKSLASVVTETEEDSTIEKKEKKGVGKFLDRLFGKDKKRDKKDEEKRNEDS